MGIKYVNQEEIEMEGHEAEKWMWFEVNIVRVCWIEAPNDPMLDEVDAELLTINNQDDDAQGGEDGEDTQPVHGGEDEEDSPHVHGAAQNSSRITVVQSTYEWSRFRDSLAEAMFRDYQNRCIL
ncbi:OLC1v1004880C1 [Oldenlandia corymbosa var. corymbosa]|nr:OLC1v1004880C1 [Oldenlandia corymbosa var. corymbosa]